MSKESIDDFETQGALYKRKDFLGKEEDAKNHPNRTYYFRKNVDVDKLIESCTRKLTEDPENTKALLIRASSYVKKQQYQLSIGDYTRAVAMNPNDFRNKQGSKYYSKQNNIDCMKVVKKLKNKKGWKWK